MGGLTILPDCLIEDIVVGETSLLLLPGADTWNDPRHEAVIEKAKRISRFRRYGVRNLWGYRCPCPLWLFG